jgi:hypothetical protein
VADKQETPKQGKEAGAGQTFADQFKINPREKAARVCNNQGHPAASFSYVGSGGLHGHAALRLAVIALTSLRGTASGHVRSAGQFSSNHIIAWLKVSTLHPPTSTKRENSLL